MTETTKTRTVKHRLTRRLGVAVMALAMVTTVAVSCTPGTTPPTTEQFCRFFDQVKDQPTTVAEDQALLVKPDVVALADGTTVTGSACTDSNAQVNMNGATLAQGAEVLSEQGTSNTSKVAAVTGSEISGGEPVLDNLKLQALSAEIGTFGIRLKGNVAVTLSGTTSTIGFVGTLQDLNNWSIQLSSSNLTIPGMTVSPVVFSGTLTVTNGVPSLVMTANASNVKIGDISVTGANVQLNASPVTGVSAAVSGTIKVGPTTASGNVAVTFDRAGALVSAKADIAAHLVGTMTGGKKADLQGTVHLDGNSQQTAISFSASGIVGDLIVNKASGDLTLATNKATFVGVLDVQQGANVVRFNGSIVWDGITAATPYLAIQGSGEISGTLQDGQTISVKGTLDTEIIGSQIRAVITGDFQVGTLKASGSAIVEGAGTPTVTLTVDAQLQDAGFSANLAGVVVITDGRAEAVNLTAGVTGQVKLGDVVLNGANLSIASTYGSTLALSFAGQVQIGSQANLSGSLDAAFGPNGSLLSLTGQMNGSLNLGTWALLNFSGSVVANPDQVTVTGSGGLSTINFPLGVQFNGSFTSSLTSPSWSLNGSGQFRIGSITIASARMNLSQAAGMRATRAGFYFSIIGIPTYLEADFYMKSTGGCDHVTLTGGSFLARPLARLALPGVVGCPVN